MLDEAREGREKKRGKKGKNGSQTRRESSRSDSTCGTTDIYIYIYTRAYIRCDRFAVSNGRVARVSMYHLESSITAIDRTRPSFIRRR